MSLIVSFSLTRLLLRESYFRIWNATKSLSWAATIMERGSLTEQSTMCDCGQKQRAPIRGWVMEADGFVQLGFVSLNRCFVMDSTANADNWNWQYRMLSAVWIINGLNGLALSNPKPIIYVRCFESLKNALAWLFVLNRNILEPLQERLGTSCKGRNQPCSTDPPTCTHCEFDQSTVCSWKRKKWKITRSTSVSMLGSLKLQLQVPGSLLTVNAPPQSPLSCLQLHGFTAGNKTLMLQWQLNRMQRLSLWIQSLWWGWGEIRTLFAGKKDFWKMANCISIFFLREN